MPVVRAGLGNDVDDTAKGTAVFRPKAVVDDAKFADCFLRWRCPLGRGYRVDIVRAIDGDDIAEVAHPSKRYSGHLELGKRGLQAGAPGRDPGGQQSKVREQAAADRQGLDFLPVDNLADLGS